MTNPTPSPDTTRAALQLAQRALANLTFRLDWYMKDYGGAAEGPDYKILGEGQEAWSTVTAALASPQQPAQVAPYPVIALGQGLLEVAHGKLEGKHALVFGKNGTGTIGEITGENYTHAEGETLAVVTFDNVGSLEVVQCHVNALRTVLSPNTEAPAPQGAPQGLREAAQALHNTLSKTAPDGNQLLDWYKALGDQTKALGAALAEPMPVAPSLLKAAENALHTLFVLARLGNGDMVGNSTGNEIAHLEWLALSAALAAPPPSVVAVPEIPMQNAQQVDSASALRQPVHGTVPMTWAEIVGAIPKLWLMDVEVIEGIVRAVEAHHDIKAPAALPIKQQNEQQIIPEIIPWSAGVAPDYTAAVLALTENNVYWGMHVGQVSDAKLKVARDLARRVVDAALGIKAQP